MTEQLTLINPSEFGLDEKQAVSITSGLSQILAERSVLAEQYAETVNLEILPENIPVFKALRLKIRDNRTKGIEVWHKTNKEFYLKGGQFVDAIKRKEVAENERMEAALLEAEQHFERLEQQRLEKLQKDREIALSKYVESPELLKLSEMPDDVFEAYLSSKKAAHIALVEAELKAEKERIAREKAEAEERERIRIENEKLRKEAEAREAQIAAERAKAEAEAKAREEKERKEREAREAEQRRIQAEHEAKLQAERKERERVEAELRAKAEAEAKAKAEEAARIQADLSKGDAAKVEDLIKDLTSLKTKYSFKSEKNKKKYSEVCALLDKVINHIKN